MLTDSDGMPLGWERWTREEYRAWRRLQPHYCAVCGVRLEQAAVDLGNDGSVLCPAHIGTVA